MYIYKYICMNTLNVYSRYASQNETITQAETTALYLPIWLFLASRYLLHHLGNLPVVGKTKTLR